ncbi:recombinase family protein [Neobacillus mesonae]|uniref:recombinase family protein n=1 Tax=Neobacillus mesonae TaxID=1193713 RepID=UPI00203E4B2D|nr:recombinase family protein [Neobacillus mesonae]MCM3571383.1 recombinase family protein [Neobacillus mesonae]
MKKRVWTLYRVSSKKQVNVDDDIPNQRKACHRFVESKTDWEITNELYEKGISGWKKKADERDEVVEIKEAAINNEFDVLLVFMFDRIGRRDEETPFVVEFLVKQGIEVWSVNEGQTKIEQHVDKLLNYIRFWQAAGESEKTSDRVRAFKANYAEEGYFQGGAAAYGYKLVMSDIPHLKKKDMFYKKEVPDEYESEIVKLVFDLYVNRHYGCRKICDYLNEKGYRSRDHTLFGVSTISRMLENPIYIGRKRYQSYRGKKGDTQPYKEELRIIGDELFEKAQAIKKQRREAFRNDKKKGVPGSGKLMFSGLAFCEVCGTRLSGNYNYRETPKKGKPGEVYKRVEYRYRCPANKGTFNHGQNIWGARKYDNVILAHIKEIIRNMDLSLFIDKSIDKKKQEAGFKEKLLKNLGKEKDKYKKHLDKLNSEIANSLLGESSFTQEQLSAAINAIQEKYDEVIRNISVIESELNQKKENDLEVRNKIEELKNWEEKFEGADHDLKKVMLSRVINKVYFSRGHVNIEFNDYIEEILHLIEKS